MKKLSKELLRYGEYISDTSMKIDEKIIRNRIIKLDGKTYIHHMINGEVVEVREI